MTSSPHLLKINQRIWSIWKNGQNCIGVGHPTLARLASPMHKSTFQYLSSSRNNNCPIYVSYSSLVDIFITTNMQDTFTASLKVKGRVHCFSMQVVINKCFLQNPEKINLAQIRLVVFEKYAKNAPLISTNDAIKPKARLL